MGPMATGAAGGNAPDMHRLTEVVNRLRKALRTSIRTDYPWETLPLAQVEMLQTLAESSPTRVSDLATRMRLAQSTVSGLLGQMLTAGLVERSVDPTDRRQSVVTLAEAGRKQLTDWQQAHEQRLSAAVEALSSRDRAAIAAAVPALEHLVERLASGDMTA